MLLPVATAWVCAVCGARVPIDTPFSWRCPNATADRHHVLALEQGPRHGRVVDDPNPFIAFRGGLAWDAFAAHHGMDDDARVALVRRVDAAIAAVEGHGFTLTPFARANGLSDALGFSRDGGVWVKDETGQVGGSHKARHLFTIMLHLLTAEQVGVAPWPDASTRPPLAIASCGNAALAASTLAAAVGWAIQVFVPVAANPRVVARLAELGSTVVECPRRADDPPGDPCVHRFREAVARGAVPFSVQGPENAWCLDGGRTLGWELGGWERGAGEPEHDRFDRVFVQVGGGAFAACVAEGLRAGAPAARVHTVQTAACAPLARAWQRAQQWPDRAALHWGECMWPWESVGSSAADGILDDETYDWLAVVAAMSRTGGSPVVVDEAEVLQAFEVGYSLTGIDVSATGSAGLAGLLAIRELIGDHERVAVVFSGIRR